MIKVLNNIKWTAQELSNADKRTTQRLKVCRLTEASATRDFPSEAEIKLPRSEPSSVSIAQRNALTDERQTHSAELLRHRANSNFEKKTLKKSVSTYFARTRRMTILEKTDKSSLDSVEPVINDPVESNTPQTYQKASSWLASKPQSFNNSSKK